MLGARAGPSLTGIKQVFKRAPDTDGASIERDARRIAVQCRRFDLDHLPLPLTNHATKPTTRMARMIGTQIPPSPPIQLPTPHMPPFIMLANYAGETLMSVRQRTLRRRNSAGSMTRIANRLWLASAQTHERHRAHPASCVVL